MPATRRPRSNLDASVAPQQVLAIFAARDLNGLIDAAFDMLAAAVVCDFVTAFYRSGGNGLLKARDSLGRSYSPEFMRRHIELSPAIPLALASPGIRVLSTGQALALSDRELRQTPFYREIMRPLGWRHSAALCCWGDPPGSLPVFVISVDRGEVRGDFSAQDLAALEAIHPLLACAVNRIHEGEAATTLRDGMAIAVRDGPRGVAIVDAQMHLVQANAAALRLCATWADDQTTRTGDSAAPCRVPPALVAVCRDMHDDWRRLVRADPNATSLQRHRLVPHPRVPGLTASLTMVCPTTAGLAEPTFMIEFDRRVHGVPLEALDRRVPLLRTLTHAECDVAVLVADGLSNQDVSDRLGKTIHAVKFLLHRTYRKTGVPNRAALVAALRSHPNRW